MSVSDYNTRLQTLRAEMQKCGIEAFIQRGKRSGFCSDDVQTFADLRQAADYKPFQTALSNSNHVLFKLLLDKASVLHHHNL